MPLLYAPPSKTAFSIIPSGFHERRVHKHHAPDKEASHKLRRKLRRLHQSEGRAGGEPAEEI